MKSKIYTISYILFWSIGGYTIAFLILETLFYAGTYLIEFTFFEDLSRYVYISFSYGYLLQYGGNSFIEELIRVVSFTKLHITKFYLAAVFGLGWGFIESVYRFSERDGSFGYLSTISHTIDSIILAYFIKKERPLFGFATTFILHTAYNTVGLFL